MFTEHVHSSRSAAKAGTVSKVLATAYELFLTQGGAVAKLGGEPRRPSFSFPDGRCVPAFSGRLEDSVDDHRVRIGVPISKHRALTFP